MRTLVTLQSFFIFTAFTASLAGQELASPQAVPDLSARNTAANAVAEAYRPVYASLQTSEEKRELARKLLQVGRAESKPAEKFVYYRSARNMAAKEGDLTTAFQVTDQMARDFAIDKVEMQAEVAEMTVVYWRHPDDFRRCSTLFEKLIDDAVLAKKYETAKRLTTLAMNCAREHQDETTFAKLSIKDRELAELAPLPKKALSRGQPATQKNAPAQEEVRSVLIKKSLQRQ